uniref:Putative thioesterase n=1 Tax=Streptomyces antibioticus TaxID=1890 RepID=G9VYW2_STRAT|nr:putative thioesterase [Streptomyces antibioticus]
MTSRHSTSVGVRLNARKGITMSEVAVEQELWMRRFHPAANDSPRIVVLPHAGGSANFFVPLSRALSPRLDVQAVQYPGRQDRLAEKGIEDMAEFADRIFAAIRPQSDRPLALYGHSMGAVVAFEVAHRLEASGAAPLGVVVSGRRAPSSHRDEKRHVSDDEIVAELRALSGTQAGLLADEEFLRMILPAMRSDYRAVESYTCSPDAVLSCPVLALTGDADPRTTLDEVKAWAAHTTGPFELEVFSGGHFFITDHQSRIADLVADFVSRAAGAARSR